MTLIELLKITNDSTPRNCEDKDVRVDRISIKHN